MSNNVLFAWKVVEVNESSRESNVRTSMEAHTYSSTSMAVCGSLGVTSMEAKRNVRKCGMIFFIEVGGSSWSS